MLPNKRLWTHGLIALLILISFWHFSFYFSPLLNSDSALGMVMGEYLSLPGDLYCWGQDRGGNFLPILAKILSPLTGISLLSLLSFLHYTILIFGFAGFASFLQKPLLKIALACFWFLPPWQFVEFLLYPFGLQYSILGIILYLTRRYYQTKNVNSRRKIIFWSGLCALIGLWLSDFLIVSLFALFITLIYYKMQQIFQKDFLVPFLLWMMVTVSFILFAKLQAIPSKNYSGFTFTDPADFLQSSDLVWQSIRRIFTFRSESNWQSVFWWMVPVAVLAVSKTDHWKNNKKDQSISNYIIFFLVVNTVLTLLVLFSSRWVLENGMGRRYFSTWFISGILWAIFYLDNKISLSRLSRISVTILAFISIFSSLENLYFPKMQKSKRHYIEQVNTLAPAGIIGDYWNSYVYSASEPSRLISTPHDRSVYRHIGLVEKTLDQPELYLVRDMWFKTFADTLRQFGRVLIREGEPFHLGDSDFCKYRVDSTYYHFIYRPMIPGYLHLEEKIKNQKRIDISKFRFNGFSSFDPKSPLQQVIKLTGYDDATHTSHAHTEVILKKGNYRMYINMRKEEPVPHRNGGIQCDISADGKVIHSISIASEEIPVDRFKRMPVDFNCAELSTPIQIEMTGRNETILFDYLIIEEH